MIFFIANFLLSVTVKEFLKMIKLLLKYPPEYDSLLFLEPPCRLLHVAALAECVSRCDRRLADRLDACIMFAACVFIVENKWFKYIRQILWLSWQWILKITTQRNFLYVCSSNLYACCLFLLLSVADCSAMLTSWARRWRQWWLRQLHHGYEFWEDHDWLTPAAAAGGIGAIVSVVCDFSRTQHKLKQFSASAVCPS